MTAERERDVQTVQNALVASPMTERGIKAFSRILARLEKAGGAVDPV